MCFQKAEEIDILLKALQAADAATVRSIHQLGDQGRVVRVVENYAGIEVQIGESPRKELRLSLQRWKILCSLTPSIDEAVATLQGGLNQVHMRQHLGGNTFVNVNTGIYCVDLRQFWYPPNEATPKPTRRGVGLRLHEYMALKDAIPAINANIPELDAIVPCREQHGGCSDQIDACRECSPTIPNKA